MCEQPGCHRSPLLIFIGGATIILAFAAILAIWIWHYANAPGPLADSQQVIYVPPHSSFQQINKILINSKAINADRRFAILARIIGSASHLKAGEYRFAAGISPKDILYTLQQGSTIHHAFTITEGLNIEQAANVIAQAGLADRKTFLNLIKNPDFIKRLGLKADTLEGFLFPDTYFFKKGTRLRTIIKIMVRRTGQVFTDECSQQSHSGQEIDCSLFTFNSKFTNPPPSPLSSEKGHKSTLHLSAKQALILASIVEKETGNATERPIIAQVFLSRLRSKMRLQSDPTVMYGLHKFDSPLTRRDLRIPSPYNTYTLPGLPGNPICNPGRAAIRAVMQPARTNYYYFVSQNNGSHYFSHTLKEHNRAVRKFRYKRDVRPH